MFFLLLLTLDNMEDSRSSDEKTTILHKKKHNIRVVNYLSSVPHGLTLKPKTCVVQRVQQDGPSAYAGVRPGWMVAVVGGVIVTSKSVETVISRAMNETKSFKVLFVLPLKRTSNKMLLSIRLGGDIQIESESRIVPGNSLSAQVPEKEDKPQKQEGVEILNSGSNLDDPIIERSSRSSSQMTVLKEPEISADSKSNSESAGTDEDNVLERESLVNENLVQPTLLSSPEKDLHKVTSSEKGTPDRGNVSVGRTTSYNRVLQRLDDMHLSTSFWQPGLTLDFSDGTIGLNFSDGLAFTADEKDDEEEHLDLSVSKERLDLSVSKEHLDSTLSQERLNSSVSKERLDSNGSSPVSSDGVTINPDIITEDIITDLNCTVVRRLPPDVAPSFDTWKQGIDSSSSSGGNIFAIFDSLEKPIDDVGDTKNIDEDYSGEMTDL